MLFMALVVVVVVVVVDIAVVVACRCGRCCLAGPLIPSIDLDTTGERIETTSALCLFVIMRNADV